MVTAELVLDHRPLKDRWIVVLYLLCITLQLNFFISGSKRFSTWIFCTIVKHQVWIEWCFSNNWLKRFQPPFPFPTEVLRSLAAQNVLGQILNETYWHRFYHLSNNVVVLLQLFPNFLDRTCSFTMMQKIPVQKHRNKQVRFHVTALHSLI